MCHKKIGIPDKLLWYGRNRRILDMQFLGKNQLHGGKSDSWGLINDIATFQDSFVKTVIKFFCS